MTINRMMTTFRWKYYTPNILVFLILLLALVCIGINCLASAILPCFHPAVSNMLALFLGFISISSIMSLVNRYGFKKLHHLLNLPDLNGSYRGELVSSYHIDDDPSQPHITKWVELEITQTINGFSIYASYFDAFDQRQKSSTSINVSDDIYDLDNGRYEIVYRYKNTGIASHPHQDKYGLNHHDGMAVLVFDTRTKELEGYYYNYNKERPSHGTLHLQKI